MASEKVYSSSDFNEKGKHGGQSDVVIARTHQNSGLVGDDSEVIGFAQRRKSTQTVSDFMKNPGLAFPRLR